MAHYQQLKFLSVFVEFFGLGNKDLTVLEIGSYDVNGSVRQLFGIAKYVGCDLVSGPGVDVVASGHEIKFPDHSFDVVLSTECFEHNPYWPQTLMNMERIVKPGGLVCITCASTGRVEHGTSRSLPFESPGTVSQKSEYYKNISIEEFDGFVRKEYYSSLYLRFNPISNDLYFVGRVSSSGVDFHTDDMRSFEADAAGCFKRDPSRSLVGRLYDVCFSFPKNLFFRYLSEETAQTLSIKYRYFLIKVRSMFL